MSSEWKTVSLGDCAELDTGFPFKSANYTESEDAIRLLRGDNIGQGQLRWEGVKRWGRQSEDNLSSFELRKDDLVLAMDRPWIAAGLKFARVRENDLPALLVQRVARLRPKTGVYAGYLHGVLASPDFTQYIQSVTTGTAVPHISSKQIQEYKFSLPGFSAQKLIGEFLMAMDDRIALLGETNATLEAIAQALFKSWFVDFDPVYAKQQGIAPAGMDDATAALFPDGFERSAFGLVPKGWGFVSLREVVSIFDSRRIPLSGQERAKRQGIYPYYGAAALMDHVDDYIFDGVHLLTGEDGSVADKDGFPILQYVWGKFWVNNHAHILQGRNGVSTEHLMLGLKYTNIQPFITGAVQAKLSQANMWRILFMKPTVDVAEVFGQTIAPLFESIRHNTDAAQTLATLRDTLLPRLISGQLRLPEAEEQLAEAIA